MKRFGVQRFNATFLVAALTVIAFLTVSSGCAQQKEQGVGKASAYERILQAKKIRVGYVSVPPGCIVDPATKELSGITVDILRQIGKNTDLQVEFTEEVGWATMIEGLNAGRYDMIGSNTWANPIRGKLTVLSKPIYYSGIGIWVRSDENRLSKDNNWVSMNKPDVKMGVMDGSTGAVIAKDQFPNAKLVTYTDLTGEPQLFLELTAKKVDVVFAEAAQGINFLNNNPGKIKNIAADSPIRIFANVYVLPKNEFQLKGMIDTALEDLQNSGFVDQTLKKYEPGPHAFYRVAKPYRVD
jgi:cystine transport system substrate-binding protein